MRPGGSRAATLVAAGLFALFASPAGWWSEARAVSPAGDGWIRFEGSWSAAGQRRALRAGTREAAITHLSGSLVVLKGEGLRRGFRAEAVAWDDGAGSGGGVLVLTDDRGDKVFCDLKGSTSTAGRVVEATIGGGTGIYADLVGDFSFRWQLLAKGEGDDVQGLTLSLGGRYRHGPPAGSAP